MAKVIIKFPYALKSDIRKQKYEELEKQWESGLMVIDDCTQVIILKDEDELILSEDDDQQALNDCNNGELATENEWSVSINNERTRNESVTIKELREKIQRKLRRKYHWSTWNQMWRSKDLSRNPTRSYRLMRQTKREGFAYTSDGKSIKCNIIEEISFVFYPETYEHQRTVLISSRKEYRTFDGKLIDVESTINELTLEEFKLIFGAIFNVNHEDIIRKEK